MKFNILAVIITAIFCTALVSAGFGYNQGGDFILHNVYQNVTVITYNVNDTGFTGNYSEFGKFWYNHTLAVEGLYGKWFYNMTTPANAYADVINISLTSQLAGLTGNASFNQTLTDTLYAGIQWGYNQTYSGSTYNATYATWAYNQTLAAKAYADDLNSSYGMFWYNMTSSDTTWSYNQTIPALDYTDALNASYVDIWYNHTLAVETLYGMWFYNMTITSVNDYNHTIAVETLYGMWFHNQTIPAITYANTNFYNKSANINATGYNVTANYINANTYLMGQPLTGMLGSGLISSSESAGYISGVNVTCSGLTCSYNNFTVRLASITSATPAVYCSIPAGSTAVTDNTFVTLYVDSNCAIQSTTYNTWYTTMLGKTQAWDFAHVLAHGGSAEIIDTISLEQKRLAKVRLLTYYMDQAKVVSGLNLKTDTFPYYNITSGKIVFGMDVVDIGQKNITATGDHVELVGHNGTGWQFQDQYGMNITACDNGTAVVACTGSNYRRHFIFAIGYDDTKNVAEIHQLYPSLTLSYGTLGACLDTTTNPLTYTIPDEYIGANVMLYAYCAKRTDSSWGTNQIIDLRTVKTGIATSGAETDPVWTAEKVNYDTASTVNGNIVANASLKVNKAGDTMSGILNMGTQNITNLTATHYGQNNASIYWDGTKLVIQVN